MGIIWYIGTNFALDFVAGIISKHLRCLMHNETSKIRRLIMKKIKTILILLFTCFAILSQRNVQANAIDANIFIDPSLSTVSLGNEFSLNIGIDIISSMKLAGTGIVLLYDPFILNFTDAEAGTFLDNVDGCDPSPCTQLFLWDNSIDGEAQFFNLLENLPLPELGDIGATGSGILATLHFTAIGIGTSSILFDFQDDYNELTNNFDQELNVNAVGATVNVVPEPSTLLLVGSGLIASLGVRRFKKKA